jgi:lactoylglutathione lyase
MAYVILYVSDVDTSIGFFRDVLGLPFKLQDAGYAEFAAQGTRRHRSTNIR